MSYLKKIATAGIARAALSRLLTTRKTAADMNTFTDETADAMMAAPAADVMTATAAPKPPAPKTGPTATTIANPNQPGQSLADKTHANLVRTGQGNKSPFTMGSAH
jgi:hypothetical protein